MSEQELKKTVSGSGDETLQNMKPTKDGKQQFTLHVQLIKFKEKLGTADAQALAYMEGGRGFTERANPKG